MSLTDKEKSALDEYIADKKISKAEAVRRSNYDIQNPKSAGVIATRLFKKPAARRYLDEHADEAKDRIMQIMRQEKNLGVALKAAQDVLDRTDGKPTQRVEKNTQKVTIHADFTGGTAGPAPPQPSLDSPSSQETP